MGVKKRMVSRSFGFGVLLVSFIWVNLSQANGVFELGKFLSDGSTIELETMSSAEKQGLVRALHDFVLRREAPADWLSIYENLDLDRLTQFIGLVATEFLQTEVTLGNSGDISVPSELESTVLFGAYHNPIEGGIWNSTADRLFSLTTEEVLSDKLTEEAGLGEHLYLNDIRFIERLYLLLELDRLLGEVSQLQGVKTDKWQRGKIQAYREEVQNHMAAVLLLIDVIVSLKMDNRVSQVPEREVRRRSNAVLTPIINSSSRNIYFNSIKNAIERNLSPERFEQLVRAFDLDSKVESYIRKSVAVSWLGPAGGGIMGTLCGTAGGGWLGAINCAAGGDPMWLFVPTVVGMVAGAVTGFNIRSIVARPKIKRAKSVLTEENGGGSRGSSFIYELSHACDVVLLEE